MDMLVQKAREAMRNAYAPYSQFKVGAAIQSMNGKIYSGCNIESSSYGLSMCAERVAIYNAVSKGEREFSSIAIVSCAKAQCPPCGACRQVLWDLAGNIEVVLINGSEHKRVQMSELFPLPFDATRLESV
jgi:cytidine deaminase